MAAQGNVGTAYRLMLNPERGAFLAVPVPTLNDLRDGIVDGP